jgi:hypothetical protein
VIAGIPSVNAVIFIRINKEIELLVGLDHCTDHFHAGLVVYVVVGSAMD